MGNHSNAYNVFSISNVNFNEMKYNYIYILYTIHIILMLLIKNKISIIQNIRKKFTISILKFKYFQNNFVIYLISALLHETNNIFFNIAAD